MGRTNKVGVVIWSCVAKYKSCKDTGEQRQRVLGGLRDVCVWLVMEEGLVSGLVIDIGEGYVRVGDR